tara:strand:- start:362 stop:514 length:153 start_codon:yes stop_codon:yes gene_type:complete
MINLNIIVLLLFIFFMISIGQIIRLKKDVMYLKKIVKRILKQNKQKDNER